MDTHPRHHTTSHLESSYLLRDVAIGMSDGLMVPFALATGLSGAVDSTSFILIAGIAASTAGSIALSLGGYLARKTKTHHHHPELKQDVTEDEHIAGLHEKEIKDFYANLGLSEEVQQQAVDEMTADKKRWGDFVLKHELAFQKPDPKSARNSAFNIGVSYIIGGIIPLSPYIFVDEVMSALKISVVITLCSLFIFGYIKSKLTATAAFEGAIRMTLIGAAAAACAFGMAKLVQS